MNKKLITAMMALTTLGGYESTWDMDSNHNLSRNKNKLPKQPHWKETQNDDSKAVALAKAEAKRLRKQLKDNK